MELPFFSFKKVDVCINSYGIRHNKINALKNDVNKISGVREMISSSKNGKEKMYRVGDNLGCSLKIDKLGYSQKEREVGLYFKEGGRTKIKT